MYIKIHYYMKRSELRQIIREIIRNEMRRPTRHTTAGIPTSPHVGECECNCFDVNGVLGSCVGQSISYGGGPYGYYKCDCETCCEAMCTPQLKSKGVC